MCQNSGACNNTDRVTEGNTTVSYRLFSQLYGASQPAEALCILLRFKCRKSSSGNASLQRPAESESLLRTKSAACIKAVTSLPLACLEGSFRGTNRSRWLSPAFNLGPVAEMANPGTNCSYLCNRDTPVEWQGLGAFASHGPPTDSQEGKAIYVRSSCCCPQEVDLLAK